jgi:hypothetical protein
MAASITYQAAPEDGTNLTSYSFASTAFGTAAADRQVIAVVLSRAGATVDAPTVTLGGVSASLLMSLAGGDAGNGYDGRFIFAASVPTGTTGTVAITYLATQVRCKVIVFRLVGASTTAHATATGTTNNSAITANVPANGCALAAVSGGTSSGSPVTAFTGLTERSDGLLESALNAGASDDFASSQTPLSVTANITGGGMSTYGLMLISWSESGGGGSSFYPFLHQPQTWQFVGRK